MELPDARDTKVQEANRQCQGTELYEWLVHTMPGPAWRCLAQQCSSELRRLLFCTNHALQQLILANSLGLSLTVQLPAGYVHQLSNVLLRYHAKLLNLALRSPQVHLSIRPQTMRFIPWGSTDEPTRIEASTLQQWCRFISITISTLELYHVTSLGLHEMELHDIMPTYLQTALPGLHKLALHTCVISIPSDLYATVSGTARQQCYTSLHTLQLTGVCSIQREDETSATTWVSTISLPNLKHFVCRDADLHHEQWTQHLPLHQFTTFRVDFDAFCTMTSVVRMSALILPCTSLVHLRLTALVLTFRTDLIPFLRSLTSLKELEISLDVSISAPAWSQLVNTPWNSSQAANITLYWPRKRGGAWWQAISTMALPQVGTGFPKVQLHLERHDLEPPPHATPAEFKRLAEAWQLQLQQN